MVKYNKLFEGVLDGKNNQKQICKMLSDNGGFLERHPARGYGEYVYGPTEEHPDSCKVVLKVRPEEGEAGHVALLGARQGRGDGDVHPERACDACHFRR